MIRKKLLPTIAVFVVVLSFPLTAYADDSGYEMWRLYNPNSGEHFYTADTTERDNVCIAGWELEGIGWVAPSSGDDVYRMYNPNAGEHHYTLSAEERNMLVDAGWLYEGVGWKSGGDVPLFRQYNPNQYACNHNYTTSSDENSFLINEGWIAEGIAWYAVEPGSTYSAGSYIMGTSKSPAQNMVNLFAKMGYSYPSRELGPGSAASIDEFVAILCEEAAAEGVRADLVFCQAMHETGWLQFGGDVQISQYNFAGLGATGGGEPGNSFSSVREGLRAQVQHLKCYASQLPLNNPCVDPRWNAAVSAYGRGSAPTIELLTMRWAADPEYGALLMNLLTQLQRAVV